MKLGTLGTLLMTAALVVSGAAASDKKNSNAPRTGADLAKSVRHEILMYPKYTLWDDISFRIDNGHVSLLGRGEPAV